MASPPFNIDASAPGDASIVSQFPANERTNRDIIESWLLTNHNADGGHVFLLMDQLASGSIAPGVGKKGVFVDSADGILKIKDNSGTVQYVGVPPGNVSFHAGALPTGYLEADGSAVSRSTFANLFAILGISYGAGDGSTTFNLPNINGRVIAGIDAAGARLTATGLGTAAILGAVGGTETHTLITAEMPSHTHGVTDPGHTHTSNANSNNSIQSSPGGGGVIPTPQAATINSATTGISIQAAGSGGAHKNVQPTIVLRAIIKY